MHVTINVKSPNNISEWQTGFNSAFKGLISALDGGLNSHLDQFIPVTEPRYQLNRRLGGLQTRSG